ncbi:malic enzyme-like NAD(P)-binding protein [Paenibacillus sp. JJ1722]
MPLSHPKALVEAIPEELIHWDTSKTLIATGSLFKACHQGGSIL